MNKLEKFNNSLLSMKVIMPKESMQLLIKLEEIEMELSRM